MDDSLLVAARYAHLAALTVACVVCGILNFWLVKRFFKIDQRWRRSK